MRHSTQRPVKQQTCEIVRCLSKFYFDYKMASKWCVVPQCTNTAKNNPEKLFVSVPTKPAVRKKWLELCRRDPKGIQANTNVFMCEDHFNMEKDIKNYMKYKMGFSKNLCLADGVLPSKFDCQPDRKRRLTDPSTSRAAFVKRNKVDYVELFEKEMDAIEENIITKNVPEDLSEIEKIDSEKSPNDKETSTDPIETAEKSVQTARAAKIQYRSKASQTTICSHSVSTSPFKVTTISSSTSPFKIETSYQRPCMSGVVKTFKQSILVEDEKSDSDGSCFTPSLTCLSSSALPSSSMVSESDNHTTDSTADIEKLQRVKNTLRMIHRKPLMYIGVSKECYFIIEMLHKHTNIKIEYILLCLEKIRLNKTFSELEDNFGISLSYASKLFLKNIPIIASVLGSFIVNLDKKLIRKTLPIAFRHNYYNVSCIIDCLEVDIQKPSKAVHQALTWSDYKKSNTIKYLISCTPNGLINYISTGFGGRTTDAAVVENSSFLDGLEPGMFILADRGFKHIETILSQRGIKMLRPPSVSTGTKLTKVQVRQTKVLASLRIHIERVIRRVREFHMLKQHSVVNSNMIRVLDDVIIIACALVNLQDSLIR